MSFLCRAGVAATRSTRVIQKRFGSHATHNGPEAPPTNEGFTSDGFKVILIGAIGMIALSRLDEHLTKQGEEKHPFTRYIEYYMRSEEESNRLNAQHMKLAKQNADDKILFDGAQRPPKVQLRCPDLLSNASGKRIESGTNVNVTHIVAKYH
ncbi:hypothetical protein BGX21_008001 [Mortierella sp. AD011]|nr:hypothetical protein BGX20_007629 [Mortierella sp. AD010]KAF9398262.1 hypothetical protein BGX21_008001 [Mortierella sp. AD011]